MGLFGKILGNIISTANSLDDNTPDIKCPECGTKMNIILNIAKCPKCGRNFDWQNDDDEEWDGEGMPPGCAACGGPYPDCTDSCPLFDD